MLLITTELNGLATPFKRFFNLSVFLVKTLSALLWKWVFVTVACIVAS